MKGPGVRVPSPALPVRDRRAALNAPGRPADLVEVLLRRREPDPRPDRDRVVLLVAGFGHLGGRVLAAHAGTADVELDERGISGALDGVEATLVSVGDARLEGRLEVGARPRHVRFVRTSTYRRLHERAHVGRELVLVPDRLEGLWRVRTRDLSVGGALVQDGTQLPLGARMRLELRLESAADPLRAGGRIIRAPSPSLRVVLFEQLSPGAADLVAREVRLARERDAD